MNEAYAAGAEIGGSLISSAANIYLANKAQKFSERMSNTAYQRGVKDMRAAGINPILAHSPASAPSGIAAQTENPARGFTAAVNSARMQKLQEQTLTQQNDIALEKWAQEEANMQATQRLTTAQEAKTWLESDLQPEQKEKLREEVNNLILQGGEKAENIDKIKQEIEGLKQDVRYKGYEADIKQLEQKIYSGDKGAALMIANKIGLNVSSIPVVGRWLGGLGGKKGGKGRTYIKPK